VDLRKIIADLREELTQLNASIATLEALAAGRLRRRGRPPKWLVEAKQARKAKRKPDSDGAG
jgi:hypothetical protein